MAKKAISKPFKDWLYEEVASEFGLTEAPSHPALEKLKEIKLPENHPNIEDIEALRALLKQYVVSWNEDEYKFMFISPFMSLAKYISPHFKVFTQRPLSIRYDNDTKLTEGLVEFMLAKGLQTPRKPHFFLHEYKPEKRRDNDPLGQLLIAMVAAQKMNDNGEMIYGIYVNGRNWFFVVLDKNVFSVSNPFVASDEDDIFNLFAVLLYIKDLMEALYSKMP
jgi:hypothetical protein